MEHKKQQITIPMAIISAGFLIMVGIILSGGITNKSQNNKTLSEQVGMTKEALSYCMENINAEELAKNIENSVGLAMKALPQEEMGTPYSIIVGKNGIKTEIKGNADIETIKKLIDEVKNGTVASKYEGEMPEVNDNDHLIGNKDAEIIIVEYSDYECPYCKSIHVTLENLVEESDGNIAWVFRHWPIHQNSFLKVTAAECIAQEKGNEAFWEYTKLLYGLLKTSTETVMEQL